MSESKLTPAALRLLAKREERLENDRGVAVHERRIQTALRRASQRRGNFAEGIETHTPATMLELAEALEKFEHLNKLATIDHGDDHGALYADWLRKLFHFFFEDGPHVGVVSRRIYMIARRYFPELIWFMNGTDLGLVFGDTRAAQSYRINLFFDGLKAAGVKGNRGGGCKREGTRERFAGSAKGNRNRRAAGKSKTKSKKKP